MTVHYKFFEGPTKRSRTFSWNTYLEQEKAIGAPHKLFKNVCYSKFERHVIQLKC